MFVTSPCPDFPRPPQLPVPTSPGRTHPSLPVIKASSSALSLWPLNKQDVKQSQGRRHLGASCASGGLIPDLSLTGLSLLSLRGRQLTPGAVPSCCGRRHTCTAYALNPLSASQSHLIPSGMIENRDMYSFSPGEKPEALSAHKSPARACVCHPKAEVGGWEKKGPFWSWSSGKVRKLEVPYERV